MRYQRRRRYRCELFRVVARLGAGVETKEGMAKLFARKARLEEKLGAVTPVEGRPSADLIGRQCVPVLQQAACVHMQASAVVCPLTPARALWPNMLGLWLKQFQTTASNGATGA
jgi:hypothetical protein